MYLSAILCREQQEIQRVRAASSTLANVRASAEKAAIAWGREAAAADERDLRHERRRLLNEQVADARDWIDSVHSENPDRARAG